MVPLDLVVILAYTALTVGVGIWVSRNQTTAGDYFLGARNLPALAVLFSIVATETSALTVVSVPGLAARGNLTFLQLGFGYLIGRIGVAIWLLPGYFNGSQETAYQRIETRFGPTSRRLVSVVFLVTRMLGEGVRIFAGAIPLALLTGWSVPTAIIVTGGITLVYTLFGGLKAVVWTDVIQLAVYVAGGITALVIAWQLGGGVGASLSLSAAAGKLQALNPVVSFTQTYTLLGGLIGGALLSAASHGTDQLIVQRLLATRSLREARIAVIGSGVVVILQFLLFLLVGSAIWSAGFAPEGLPADQIFPRFILEHLPHGLSGLLVAGILAAGMSNLSSSINALASSMTHDLYANWTGERDPGKLLRIGRTFSVVWGLALIVAALFFYRIAQGGDTPVVVLALSIASVTYGALLGTYVLGGRVARARGRDAVGAVLISVSAMLVVVFATRLAAYPALGWLAPVGKLAWPWYVPLGTTLTIVAGVVLSRFPHAESTA